MGNIRKRIAVLIICAAVAIGSVAPADAKFVIHINTSGSKGKTSSSRTYGGSSSKKSSKSSMSTRTKKILKAIDGGTKKGKAIGATSVGMNYGNLSDIDIKKKYGLDPSLKYLHGMYYIATVTKTVKAKGVDGLGKVKVKAGTEVVVMRARQKKDKKGCTCRVIVKKEKSKNKRFRTVKISGRNLVFQKYIVNSSAQYSNAQVEQWMNSHKITSQTKYCLFVSRYNQHAWILVKSGKKWLVQRAMPCTTGGVFSYGYPNDLYGFNHCKYFRRPYFEPRNNSISIPYSSGAGNCLHLASKARLLRPTTHGCVGFYKTQFQYVLKLPLNTRVVSF